jgi:peptide/nickel transport system permease protein
VVSVILRRIARAGLTVLLLVTFSFVVLRVSGDGATAMLGSEADPAAVAAFNARWGLDRSIPAQYLAYLGAVARGDLGASFIGRRPALQVVLERVPATLSLMVPALVISLALGLAIGTAAALRRGTALDHITSIAATAGYCIPSFIIAIALILVLSVQFGWLPTTGSATPLHYVLPVTTVTLAELAVFMRFTRAAMLEIIEQPYMRAAHAKGLRPLEIVVRHAFPNIAVPLVSVAGLSVGSLFVGATITENVFAWPGMGQLLIQGVTHRDAAVVQTIVLLVGVSMVAVNAAVDLLYPWLDPRIRSPS